VDILNSISIPISHTVTTRGNLVGITNPKDPDITHWYNKSYFTLIKPSDHLKAELKAITNIDRLKKRLITHFQQLDRLKYLSGDDRIIKLRHIAKGKRIIQKYLAELRRDSNFTINKSDSSISLNYSGKYAFCKRTVAV
jgi:hypothetical protein